MIYDISTGLSGQIVPYPGDRGFRLVREGSIESGDGYELTSFEMSSHLGTHYDAPSHFIPDGKTIDQIPLDHFIGPAQVIDLSQTEAAAISPSDISPYLEPETERLIIKTGGGKFFTQEAAELLAGCELKILGIDQECFESPDDSDGFPVHRTLLKAGMLLLECLVLSSVSSGKYDFYGLPLNLISAEAAPVRAVLMG